MAAPKSTPENLAPITPGGYMILPATSHLRPREEASVPLTWAAVVGVQVGSQRLSLAQDVLRRAARVVQQDEGPEVGAAILLYLAQIGFWPAGRQRHLRWPPTRDGAIDQDQDRRLWRRPYLSALTRQDLTWRVLPAAVEDVLRDERHNRAVPVTGKAYRAALEHFPIGPALRREDAELHDLVRWHGYTFAYPTGGVDGSDLVGLARQWAAAPRSHQLSDTLVGWISQRAAAADGAALGSLLAMVRQGHVLTHAMIRGHQHRALAEVRALNGASKRWLDDGAGLHALLYQSVALWGGETWQFTARPGGTLRITLPEIVGLGREVPALGRAWLDGLMAAYARQDEAAARDYLDRLRQVLALLTSHPEALLMRETPPSEDAWDYLDAKSAIVEDESERPGVVLSDSALKPGDSRRNRPDEALERCSFMGVAEDVLRDSPGLWDAFYLVEVEGYTYRDAAPRLGLKSASAVKGRVDAAKAILRKDPRLRDWLTP